MARVLIMTLTMVGGAAGPIAADDECAARDCETTRPDGRTAPFEVYWPGHHGNGSLFTVLPLGGAILAEPHMVEPDGSIGEKLFWYRAADVGEVGDLELSGTEVDSGAATSFVIPDGYGQRFQVAGVSFPGEGCY